MKYLFTFLAFISTGYFYGQSVGINSPNGNPDSSAVLDVWSSDKGVLLPRMTKVQRDEIVNPADGLTIFQTDESKGYHTFYDGQWNPLGSKYNDDILQIGSSENSAYLINDVGDIIDSSGIIYDSGGPSNNHGSFVNFSRTIYPPSPGALGLKITIDSMDIAPSATLLIDGQSFYDNEETIFITSSLVTTINFTNVGFTHPGFEVIFEYIYTKDLEDSCKIIPIAGGWQFDKSKNAEYGGIQTGSNWISDSLGVGSVQFGKNNASSGDFSTVFGEGNMAQGNSATSFGAFNKAIGYASFSAGSNSSSSGNGAVSLGNFNSALSNGSVALGEGNFSEGGNGSSAIGYNSYVSGYDGSLALGNGNFVTGDIGSLALGSGAQTTGSEGAISAGLNAIASGSYGSVSLGDFSESSGSFGSIAAGSNVIASGNDGAVALGKFTNASGNYGSLAAGYQTTASGNNGAIAMGYNSEAKGDNGSIAMGDGTIATGDGMMAVGVFNDTIVSTGYDNLEDKPVFVVGVGQNDGERENAIEVMRGNRINIGYENSNTSFAGSVCIGSQNSSVGGSSLILLGQSNSIVNGGSGCGVFGTSNVIDGATQGSLALGSNNTTYGWNGSVGIGFGNIVKGDLGSVGLGAYNTVNGFNGAIAIGRGIQSNANSSVAVGVYNDTIVGPNYNGSDTPVFMVGVGEGPNTRENALVIRKENRIAIGEGNIVTNGGGENIAIGKNNNVFGSFGSTAVGANNILEGNGAVALGYGNNVDGGSGAGALGFANTVDGGSGSIAIGAHVTTNAIESTSVGRYNDPIVAPGYFGSDGPVFIVGTGEFDALENGLEVYRGGDVIVNSLSGIGSRKVFVDNNGKLNTTSDSEYYSVYHNSFVIDYFKDGCNMVHEYDESSVVDSDGDPCDTKLFAPVNLPHNAKIISVKYNYTFNNSAQQSVNAFLVARKYNDASSFEISNVFLFQGSGAQSGVDTLLDPLYQIVDNSTYSYYVQIGNPSDIPSWPEFTIRGVIIEYIFE